MTLNRALLVPLGLCFIFTGKAFAESHYDGRSAQQILQDKERLQYSKKYRPRRYSSVLDDADPYRDAGYPYHYSLYLRNAVPFNQEFNFQKMTALIKDKNLKTIESVIGALPSSMTDENYVLMYRSRSLQAATPEAPRAIVYTPTAHFILTFNGGGAKTPGGNTIETIEFKQDENKFEFREITFDGVNEPVISAPNPKKCMECHQSPSRQNVDMRPNWEPYSVWIGAYGSDDGDFSSSALKDQDNFKKRIKPQDQEALEEQAHEFEFFKHFINEVKPQHPRYSKLKKFNLHAPVDLTDHLSFWNSLRLMRLMREEREIFSLYKEAFALVLNCGRAPKDLLQSQAFQWHFGFDFPQYFDTHENAPDLSPSLFITSVFEPLGVDTSDWSMDFGTGGRFAFRQRFGTPSNISNTLENAWRAHFPESESENCQSLFDQTLKKVDQAFSQREQLQIREKNLNEVPAPTAQGILSRCIRCHVEDTEGWIPSIPFDQPDKLSQALQGKSRHGKNLFEEIQYRTSEMAVRKDQMPPSRRLSARERETLINYLNELKGE